MKIFTINMLDTLCSNSSNYPSSHFITPSFNFMIHNYSIIKPIYLSEPPRTTS
jgi:hypothetical protein